MDFIAVYIVARHNQTVAVRTVRAGDTVVCIFSVRIRGSIGGMPMYFSYAPTAPGAEPSVGLAPARECDEDAVFAAARGREDGVWPCQVTPCSGPVKPDLHYSIGQSGKSRRTP